MSTTRCFDIDANIGPLPSENIGRASRGNGIKPNAISIFLFPSCDKTSKMSKAVKQQSFMAFTYTFILQLDLSVHIKFMICIQKNRGKMKQDQTYARLSVYLKSMTPTIFKCAIDFNFDTNRSKFMNLLERLILEIVTYCFVRKCSCNGKKINPMLDHPSGVVSLHFINIKQSSAQTINLDKMQMVSRFSKVPKPPSKIGMNSRHWQVMYFLFINIKI
ncbi:hypothetical protein QYF36_017276 [Acer negundo]|nr:hypothetical protein QYF36_017276 [Acer negundo]